MTELWLQVPWTDYWMAGWLAALLFLGSLILLVLVLK